MSKIRTIEELEKVFKHGGEISNAEVEYYNEYEKECSKKKKSAPRIILDPGPIITIDDAIKRLSDVRYSFEQGTIDASQLNALTNVLKASIAAMRERTTDEAEKMMDQLDQGARIVGPSRPVLVLANPEKDDPEPGS